MINTPALVTTCLLSAGIAAAAPADSPTRVTGNIIAIEPQGEWELGALDAREGHWLYPYAAAMIRVAEAAPDSTAPIRWRGESWVWGNRRCFGCDTGWGG